MNRLRNLTVVITIAAMIGLTGCSSATTAGPASDATASVSLAATVQSNLDKSFPDGIPTDDILYAMAKIEDVSEGTIRAYIQYDLSDSERQQAADEVQGLGWTEDLKTVVIRDASGLDSNHFFN